MTSEKREARCSNCERNYWIPEEKFHEQFTCISCRKKVILIGRDEALEDVVAATPIPDEWRQSSITLFLENHYGKLLTIVILLILIPNGTYKCGGYTSQSQLVTDVEEARYTMLIGYKNPAWTVEPDVYLDDKKVLSGSYNVYSLDEMIVEKFGLTDEATGKRWLRVETKHPEMQFQKEITFNGRAPYVLIMIDHENEEMDVRMSNRKFDFMH